LSDGYLDVDENEDNGDRDINSVVELFKKAPTPAEMNDRENDRDYIQKEHLYKAMVGPGVHARLFARSG